MRQNASRDSRDSGLTGDYELTQKIYDEFDIKKSSAGKNRRPLGNWHSSRHLTLSGRGCFSATFKSWVRILGARSSSSIAKGPGFS